MNFSARLRLPRLERPSGAKGVWGGEGAGLWGAVGEGIWGSGQCGAHPGLQGEPLGARVGPVPGAQRDLHLAQEEIPAQAVVVPHRQVQRPALQVPLLQLVLVRMGGGHSRVRVRGLQDPPTEPQPLERSEKP